MAPMDDPGENESIHIMQNFRKGHSAFRRAGREGRDQISRFRFRSDAPLPNLFSIIGGPIGHLMKKGTKLGGGNVSERH